MDVGLIGCFPVDVLSGTSGLNLGNIITFENDFECHTVDCDGIISIGNIEIYTDNIPFNDEDEGNYDSWIDEPLTEEEELAIKECEEHPENLKEW